MYCGLKYAKEDGLNVVVVPDDQGIVAAHLQRNHRVVRTTRRPSANGSPGCSAPSQKDPIAEVDKLKSNLRTAVNKGNYVTWHSSFYEELHVLHSKSGRLLARLHNHCVASQ